MGKKPTAVPELEDFKFSCTDFKKTTLDGFLKQLLLKLLIEGENFSAKRPFGNGGWLWDLNDAIVKKYPKLGITKQGIYIGVDERIDISIAKRIEKIFENSKKYEQLEKESRLLESADKADLKSVALKKA